MSGAFTKILDKQFEKYGTVGTTMLIDLALANPNAFERQFAVRPTEVLGSGAFGTVLGGEHGPWVAKITEDPDEVPMWMELAETGTKGFAALRKIEQLGDGFAIIVREQIMPVIDDAGTGTYLSEFSLNLVEEDIPDPTRHLDLRMLSLIDAKPAQDLYLAMHFSNVYFLAARVLHHMEQGDELDHVPEEWRDRKFTTEKLKIAIERLQETKVGKQLGLTLQALSERGLVLFDLHDGNIGWRIERKSKELPEGLTGRQKPYLVVFDPGHTPTGVRFEVNPPWRWFTEGPR